MFMNWQPGMHGEIVNLTNDMIGWPHMGRIVEVRSTPFYCPTNMRNVVRIEPLLCPYHAPQGIVMLAVDTCPLIYIRPIYNDGDGREKTTWDDCPFKSEREAVT